MFSTQLLVFVVIIYQTYKKMNRELVSVLDIAKGIRLPRFKRLQLAYAILISSVVFAPLALITIILLFRLGVYRYQKESYIGAKYLQAVAFIYIVTTIGVYAMFGWQATMWLIVPKMFLLIATYRAAFRFYRIINKCSNIRFARGAHQYMVEHNECKLVLSALGNKGKTK